MMRKIFLLFLVLPLLALADGWMKDTELPGYEIRHVDMPDDYSGMVQSTIIRNEYHCPDSHKGVLYVHGYNDYFFQKEMGDRFADSCYRFYAVDLRKYGRSIMTGQTKFELHDMKEYFADIDSAVAQMKRDGVDSIILMGHSTGGLTTSLYMNNRPDPAIKALVLNSPFLDWNMNGFMRKIAIPTVGSLGKIFPRWSLSQGNSTAYAESLLKDYNGEWDYNTKWKTIEPQKVEASWLRAIDKGQGELQKGAHIDVPILLMHSDKSVFTDKWTPECQHGDAVLNVDHIIKYGTKLGADVTNDTIPGGLHDLALSEKPVREKFYTDIFKWLKERNF